VFVDLFLCVTESRVNERALYSGSLVRGWLEGDESDAIVIRDWEISIRLFHWDGHIQRDYSCFGRVPVGGMIKKRSEAGKAAARDGSTTLEPMGKEAQDSRPTLTFYRDVIEKGTLQRFQGKNKNKNNFLQVDVSREVVFSFQRAKFDENKGSDVRIQYLLIGSSLRTPTFVLSNAQPSEQILLVDQI